MFQLENSSVKGIIHDYNVETKYQQITCHGILLEFFMQLKRKIALMFTKRFFGTTIILTFMQIPLMFG